VLPSNIASVSLPSFHLDQALPMARSAHNELNQLG
jgi:hypothetical protein